MMVLLKNEYNGGDNHRWWKHSAPTLRPWGCKNFECDTVDEEHALLLFSRRSENFTMVAYW